MKRRDFITSSSLALTLPLFPAWEGYSADSIIPSEYWELLVRVKIS